MRTRKSLQFLVLAAVLVLVAVALPGTALAASGGPDAFGYTYNDSIPYDWESFAGTVLSLDDEDMSAALPLGFTFSFYGVDYTDVYVSSNGFITLLPGQYEYGLYRNAPLPTPGKPDATIAGLWGDLDPDNGNAGTIRYTTLGTAPNRRFIVSYEDVPYWAEFATVTFQIKLFEGSNNIEVHYLDASNANHWGDPVVGGIEDEAGAVGLQYLSSFSDPAVPAGTAVLYTMLELEDEEGGPLPWVGTLDVMLTGYVSSPAAVAGDVLTWTFEVYNPQEDLWSYGLSLLADVPDTLEILSVTTTSGEERDPRAGQAVWVDFSNLAPGEGVRIEVETQVLASAGEVCVPGAVADLGVLPCMMVYPGELPVTGDPNPALWVIPAAVLVAGLGGWALMRKRRVLA